VADRAPELSILMPVYNETATVDAAVRRVLGTELPVDGVELLVVDDGSTDGSRELIEHNSWGEGVRVILHDSNRGKGSSVRTALRQARGTYCAIMDADLEYDPADLRKLLEPLLAGRAEVVFGTRGFDSHSSYSSWYVAGNKAVTLAADVLFNARLNDIMTCQKVIRTEVFRSLDLRARGFTIEAEITARLLADGHRIHEVPISYRARSREEGKKLTALDGVRVLGTLVRCRLAR
jgi:dolichol-phosphate hexosyltransferase